MARPEYIRSKAQQMRAERLLTIDEIAERLALPRTTVYHWVRNIPIVRKPGRPLPSDAQRKGTEAMQTKYRLLREAAYASGAGEFGRFAADDPTFRDFVCLYLAEGYKRDRNVVSIANSDPAVMVLSARWMRRLAGRPLGFALQYHADQDVAVLRRFWADRLGLDDPRSIRVQRKSNSGRLAGRTWRSAHGVLTIRACDTDLRARMEAWMDLVRAGWT
jgi:hypothetical protein